MNGNQMLLAEMFEKKSQYGNTYFEGFYQEGGKIVLRKIKKGQISVWQLFWIKHN